MNARDHCFTKAVLVEFVGAAGVGKSFLSARVLDALKRRNLPVANFRAIDINKYDIRIPWTVLRSTYLAASIKPKSLKEFGRAAREIAKLQLRWYMCRRRPGIYLCDEGLIHRLRGFSRGSNQLSMIDIADRLVRHVVVGQVVVVLEASVDKIYSRRTQRQKPGDNFSYESIAADVQLIQKSIATIRHLQQSLNGAIRMVPADGEQECFDRVAEEIAEMARSVLFDASTTG